METGGMLEKKSYHILSCELKTKRSGVGRNPISYSIELSEDFQEIYHRFIAYDD